MVRLLETEHIHQVVFQIAVVQRLPR